VSGDDADTLPGGVVRMDKRRTLHDRRWEHRASGHDHAVSNEELRALVAGLRDQIRIEREDRRDVDNRTRERMEALERNHALLHGKLIKWGTIAGLILALAAWFGPTRLVSLIKALAGQP